MLEPRNGRLLSLARRVACAGALVAVAGAALPAPARADEIKLKTGRPIGPEDVEVTDETYEFVTYKIRGSQQQEEAGNVVEVIYSRLPAVHEMEADFGGGQYARVVEECGKYKDQRDAIVRQYAYFYLGEAKRMNGDFAGAQEAYDKLLNDFPKTRFYARARVGQGLLLVEQKQFSAAQKVFEDLSGEAKSKKLGDDVASEANLRLAGLLEMQGKMKEAQDRYDRVAAAAPAGSHGALMAQVAALRIKGSQDASKADSCASTLLGIFDGADPANLKGGARADFELLAACSNALGEVRTAKGDYQKAMVDFLRVAFDPDLSAIASERPRALFGAAQAIEKAKTDDWKGRAESLRAELRSTYPNSPFAKKLGG